MTADPYNLRPAIKFIAPYGLSECRQRLRRNAFVEKEDDTNVYKFSVATWHLPKSNNRAAFKITGMEREKQRSVFSNYLVELHGTLTYLSAGETLVEANFKTQINKREFIVIFVIMCAAIVLVGDLNTANIIVYLAGFLLLSVFLVIIGLIGFGSAILSQRNVLRTLLTQELNAGKVELRNPKEVA